MSVVQQYPFTNPGNYTFPPTMEVAGGFAQLKLLTITDETFMAQFVSTINGSRGAGALTGSETGGVVIANKRMNLKGATLKYVDWDADLNADSQQVGCIRIKYIPNYSGIPAETQVIWLATQADNNKNNLLQFVHAANGDLSMAMFDEAGINAGSTIFISGWNPTAGTTYELEVNWDFTAGATRCFLAGIKQGATETVTFTRSASIGLMRVGGTFNASVNEKADFELNDLQIFSTVQHTANFASEVPRLVGLYDGSNPSGSVNATFQADGLEQFLATVVESGSDLVKFIIKVGTQKKYWDGAAWANSDGTYSQASIASDIHTNRATIGLSAGAAVQVFFLLHSEDGSTTPQLDLIDILYDFFNPGTSPNLCIVSGEILDNTGSPVVGATVEVDGDDYYYGSALIARKATTTTDLDGKWEMTVVETATDTKTVTFTTKYTQIENGKSRKKTRIDAGITVPDQATVNLADIL